MARESRRREKNRYRTPLASTGNSAEYAFERVSGTTAAGEDGFPSKGRTWRRISSSEPEGSAVGPATLEADPPRTQTVCRGCGSSRRETGAKASDDVAPGARNCGPEGVANAFTASATGLTAEDRPRTWRQICGSNKRQRLYSLLFKYIKVETMYGREKDMVDRLRQVFAEAAMGQFFMFAHGTLGSDESVW